MTDLDSLLTNLNYTNVKVRGRGEQPAINYINLPCGFDIETTSTVIEHEGDKVAFMYVWMLGLGHDNPIIYGRTWDEFKETIAKISDKLGLSLLNRLVVYVHNLSYEFQFMRNHFNFTEVFAIGERKPIKAVITEGIEFRDSYILSGFSLANTAKNLTHHKIDKMEGDLDYSLIRHSKTPLTKEEIGYCDNDINIITAYITEQMAIYGDITKIPMTNTGRVRQYVKSECHSSGVKGKKASRSQYHRYRQLMSDLTLDSDTYKQLKRGFMGGFTHANANYSGKTLENVTSIDFTSSYPAVMVSEKFPMTRFRKAKVTSVAQLEELCSKYAVIFDVQLDGVTSNLSQESYISSSKCFNLINPVINNGRIYSAGSLTTTITDVDFEIMKVCYSWEAIAIGEVRVANKEYLPKAIIKSILDLYQDKTELKDVEGSEVEYLLSKGMLNSIYGMSVTDIAKDQATYGDGAWELEPVILEEAITNYNESKNRFLYYPWGLWVTAYARKNLWTGIVAVGDDYVYSDTDALKLLNYEAHKDYVEWYDQDIIRKMEEMCEHYNFDKKLLKPKTKDGVEKMLGVWDYEGTYPMFKTLGAKRYLVEHRGKLELTVAGLSKQNGIDYLLDKTEGDFDKVFELFNDELYIPANKTGKMTHTYIDNPYKFQCQDYLGNLDNVETLSGVHLESCDFTLSVNTLYKQFLNSLTDGYIYSGVKHV